MPTRRSMPHKALAPARVGLVPYFPSFFTSGLRRASKHHSSFVGIRTVNRCGAHELGGPLVRAIKCAALAVPPSRKDADSIVVFRARVLCCASAELRPSQNTRACCRSTLVRGDRAVCGQHAECAAPGRSASDARMKEQTNGQGPKAQQSRNEKAEAT